MTLTVDETVKHNINAVLEKFKNCHCNLLKKLSKPSNKNTLNSDIEYYKSIIQINCFGFASVSKNIVLTILKYPN